MENEREETNKKQVLEGEIASLMHMTVAYYPLTSFYANHSVL